MRLGLFDGPRGRLLGAVLGADVINLATLVPGTPAEGLAAILALDATHLALLTARVTEARASRSEVHALEALVPAPPFAGTKTLYRSRL